MVSLALVIHRALDFFFCDRCPSEGSEYCAGRPIENESKVADIIDNICLIQYIFKLLPEEPWEDIHRIRFPRSWMEGQNFHKEEV